MSIIERGAAVLHADPFQTGGALAVNIRRLMVRQALTRRQLAGLAGVDLRTLKQILSGAQRRPHARTLARLADGLGVSSHELFRPPQAPCREEVDRRTNVLVDEVLAEHPRRVERWTSHDFRQLYSQFGAGGALTREGTLATIDKINQRRAVQEKVALLMETHEAGLLTELVDALYRRVVMTPAAPPAGRRAASIDGGADQVGELRQRTPAALQGFGGEDHREEAARRIDPDQRAGGAPMPVRVGGE